MAVFILNFVINQRKLYVIKKQHKKFMHYKQCGINRELGLPDPLTRTQKIGRKIFFPCYALKLVKEKGPQKPPQKYEKKFKKARFLQEIWNNKLTNSQRECFESICFHFIGILIAWGVFLFNYYFTDEDFLQLIIKCSILLIFISLSMAFSKYIRCLILVALPMVSSSRTRAILLTYMLLGVINGPLRNTRVNIAVTWESFKCSRQYGENTVKVEVQGAETYKFVQSVLNSTQQCINRMAEAADMAASKADQAMEVFKNATVKVVEVIERFTTICNGTFSGKYTACLEIMEEALPASIAYSVCAGLTVSTPIICNLKEMDLSVGFPRGMEDVAEKFRNAFRLNTSMETNFYTIITEESRGNLSAVFQEYVDFYYDYFEWFVYLLIANNLISFLMYFILIYRARSYIRKFRTKDSFDNQYITDDLLDLEMKRLKDNLPTILPLSWSQQHLFIRIWTLEMTKREYRRFLLGLIYFGAVLMVVVFFYVLDMVVYWPIKFVRNTVLGMDSDYPLPSVKVQVQGRGPIGEFYKNMNNGTSRAAQEGFKAATECCPNPIELSKGSFKGTLLKLMFIFITILLEPYALRTQHIVAGWLYPLRRLTRTAWLYSYILVTKPIRPKVNFEERDDGRSRKTPFVYKLAIVNPCFRKFFSIYVGKIIFCAECARIGIEGDLEHFTKCFTPGCSGIFCKECLVELKTPCPVCNNLPSYGEGSGIDEEVDSSEEGSTLEFQYNKRDADIPLTSAISQAMAFSGEEFLQNLDYLIPEKTSSVTSYGSLGAVIDEEIDAISTESDPDHTLIAP
ncbi:DC-STAMP domain-containing protein 2-like [Brevipalpus obovatus]|uniref:DC-STAMP domain-containing protein 2-like n=1 Tax=Brevipalpus obovatus TaxID=246614 RepID=UPI003D9F9779